VPAIVSEALEQLFGNGHVIRWGTFISTITTQQRRIAFHASILDLAHVIRGVVLHLVPQAEQVKGCSNCDVRSWAWRNMLPGFEAQFRLALGEPEKAVPDSRWRMHLVMTTQGCRAAPGPLGGKMVPRWDELGVLHENVVKSKR
jgi:hypothetical protein